MTDQPAGVPASGIPAGGSAASGAPAVGAGRQSGTSARRIVGLVGAENLSLLIALAILVLLIASQSNKFFLSQNLLNIGQNISVVGLVAVGETIIIVAGMLDISVGSIAGVASVVAALVLLGSGDVVGGSGLAVSAGNAPLAVAGGVLAGLLLGLVNGFIITALRVNAVIATLATLSAFRGLAFLIAPEGKPVTVLNQSFISLGTGRLDLIPGWPIPISLLVLLTVAIGFAVLMRYMDFGRAVYALGGNPAAARLAGIHVTRLKLSIYALSGAAAGMAGIILTARTNSGQPASGSQGLELEAITAVFLGGASLQGGRGTIAGTMLAVVLIGALSNGMNLLGIPTFYQLVAKGALLVVAVAISQWRQARAERARTRVAA